MQWISISKAEYDKIMEERKLESFTTGSRMDAGYVMSVHGDVKTSVPVLMYILHKFESEEYFRCNIGIEINSTAEDITDAEISTINP